MELIDRLLGRPTLASLISQVRQYLLSQGVTVVEVLQEQREVVALRNGSSIRIFLGNLHHEYIKAKRGDRPGLVKFFLDGLLRDAAVAPGNYTEAKAMLLPVVRNAGALGVAMTARLRMADAKPISAIVRQQLVADLAMSLVIDSPSSMSYVTEDNLNTWNVTLDQAVEDALHNLRGLPEHGGWTEIFPGLWRGTWGDTYESSRILLPDLIHRLGVKDPVVMVPFRDVLLVTSAGNSPAIQHLVDLATGSLEQNTRWVSFELLRLNGTVWEHYVLTEHQTQLQELSKRNLAESYASQKQILDAHFQDQAIDLFVGTHQLVQTEGEGLSSYAVWSEGVDTLMPQADKVALVRPEHKEFKPFLVPWAVAQEHFGSFFEETDYAPTRFRLRKFPEPQAVESVRMVVEGSPRGGIQR